MSKKVEIEGLTKDEQRMLERNKYVELLSTRPSYGASNHGKGAKPLVHAFLIDKDGGTVVDFGCGDNSFIKSISNSNISGVGVDFVNPKADLIEPMHKVSLPDGYADVVTSFDALEHLLPEEVDEVLKEMFRISKPCGIFIYSISHRPSSITSLGKNLHPTVEPMEWWMDKLKQYCVNLKFNGKYLTGEWI